MIRDIHYVTDAPAPAGEYELPSNMAAVFTGLRHTLHVMRDTDALRLPGAARHMRSVGVGVRVCGDVLRLHGRGAAVILLGKRAPVLDVPNGTRVFAYAYHAEPSCVPRGALHVSIPGRPGDAHAYPGVQARRLNVHKVQADGVAWLAGAAHGQYTEAAARRARALIPGKALISIRSLAGADGDSLLAEFRRSGHTELCEITPGAGLQLLRMCRVLLYDPAPGYVSPYGHTAWMAMAMGIPVVTRSTQPAVASAVSAFASGIVCDSDSHVTEALSRILGDADLRAKMGRNGQLAAGRHDISNTTIPWRELLDL